MQYSQRTGIQDTLIKNYLTKNDYLKRIICNILTDMSEVLREFQCKMCFKILGSRAALQRHLKEVHHKVAAGKEVSGDEKERKNIFIFSLTKKNRLVGRRLVGGG